MERSGLGFFRCIMHRCVLGRDLEYVMYKVRPLSLETLCTAGSSLDLVHFCKAVELVIPKLLFWQSDGSLSAGVQGGVWRTLN